MPDRLRAAFIPPRLGGYFYGDDLASVFKPESSITIPTSACALKFYLIMR